MPQHCSNPYLKGKNKAANFEARKLKTEIIVLYADVRILFKANSPYYFKLYYFAQNPLLTKCSSLK